MADPFSTIAGVAGVATAAASLACSLFQIAKSLRLAGEEINLFAMQISSLSSVLKFAHGFLSSHLTILDKITGANKALCDLNRQNYLNMSQVKTMKKQLHSFRKGITIVVRFRWLFEKHRVELLKQEIGSSISCMQLLMTTLMLAELLTQQRADRKEIERLSSQIKLLVKTVEIQKYRSGNQDNTHYDLPRNKDDLQRGLLNIAKGIIKETEEYFAANPDRASSGLNSRSGRRRHRRTAATLKAENVDSSPTSLPPESNSSQLLSRLPSMQMSSTPESSPSQSPSDGREEAGCSIVRPNGGEDKPTPQLPDSANYISVGPIGYNLDVDNLETAEAISGYINGQNVTVLLVPEFNNNLISMNFAASQGLCVPPLHEEAEGKWIDFNNGKREPIVGDVAIKWKRSNQPGAQEFTVWCSVCRHNIRDVVFGQPFIRKQRALSKQQH